MHSLQPGLGSASQDIIVALEKLLAQLLAKAWEETRLSSTDLVRGGNLRSRIAGAKVSKILVRRQGGCNQKSSMKHRLIWIADLFMLQMYIENARSTGTDKIDLESYGVWRCVVSESSDQITVSPRVQGLPCGPRCELREFTDDNATQRVLMLIGPDLHRYVLIYESLCGAMQRYSALMDEKRDIHVMDCLSTRFRHAHLLAGMPLLRAWLGLHTYDASVVNTVLGLGDVRESLLARAQES